MGTANKKKSIYIIDRDAHINPKTNETEYYAKEVYLALNVRFNTPWYVNYPVYSGKSWNWQRKHPGLYIEFFDINFLDILKRKSGQGSSGDFMDRQQHTMTPLYHSDKEIWYIITEGKMPKERE